MSLSSSLFSGVSGLSNLGNSMNIIGDNIANINTVGFKASRATFQDAISESISTASGSSQIGRGTGLSDINQNFSQGSFESTDSNTDLAIGGEGFFVVRDPNNEQNDYYTRAGQFQFDKDGNFVNPSGYIVQGWALNKATGENEGSITDIKLNSFTSSPEATDNITVIANLDADGDNNSQNTTDDDDNFALSEAWDGDNTDGLYIAEGKYEYKTTLKAYDSLGSTHDITVYFDKGVPIAPDTDPVWEYIVTCNPSEDKRVDPATAKDNLGLLARGTIEFNATSGKMSGEADTITCEVNDGAGTYSPAKRADGYFCFEPEFIDGEDLSVALNLGAHFKDSNDGDPLTGVWENDSLSTTQYASASTTVFQTGNGYGSGDLQSFTVDSDGVITGQYSNGQVIPLYKVALAKFQNNNGLSKEGGNLYSQTRLSGDPITNSPGTNGLGNISANSLEQSNVDIADEFVKMITTQRGYQANSKIITTTDSMLADVIAMKR
jgi:flagellar hook protein FlgE